ELKEKLNDQTTGINKKHQKRFNDKQEHVDAIIKIVLAEHESVYNDINLLIRDSERFSLENLMNYGIIKFQIKFVKFSCF
ncbi:5149_t:CDS:1, partial [Entrophospora sp. SA101]